MGRGLGWRRGYRFLDPGEQRRALAMLDEGMTLVQVGAVFGVSRTSIARLRDEAWLRRRRVWHSPHRLSWEERERISRGLAVGESARAIARVLGRAPSTVSREIARCGGRERYRAVCGEVLARDRCRRPKPRKLASSARLLAAVEEGLVEGWSQQISARLKAQYRDDQEMRISHETIYLSLFVQSRGELRRELSACLRTGRTRRRAQGRQSNQGRIPGMVNISERPAEVEDRAVPGHWEGDLILGKAQRSAVATLVERRTRFVMLAYLGQDRGTDRVIDALAAQITTLPGHLRRSLTWDQGREMAAHERFRIDTGVQVYFCDPRSPWQRGSNENTNGLLRQYLPKGTDLAVHDQDALDEIARRLNGRPRETLGWMTPAEKMAELLATPPGVAQDA
jgi:transposase, IS30 family